MNTTVGSPATASISRAPHRIAGAIREKANPGCSGSTRHPPFRLNSSLRCLPLFPNGGLMKRTTALVAALFISFFVAACRNSPPTLSVLVWEGYADPSFVHDFAVYHHCKIVASYMGSSDELVAKLRGGSAANYDVISPSS